MTCSRLAAIAFQTQTQTCPGLSHSKKKLLLLFFFIKSGNMGDVKRNRSWLFCEFHSLMSESTFGQVVAVAKKTKSVE